MKTKLIKAFRLVFGKNPNSGQTSNADLAAVLLENMPKVLSRLGYGFGRELIYYAIQEVEWPDEETLKKYRRMAVDHAVEEIYFEFTDPEHPASNNLDPDLDYLVLLYREKEEEYSVEVSAALSGMSTSSK